MQFFIDFVYEVNVRFNFRSQQTHTGMNVLSAIPFRVAFQSLLIEKAISQNTNMGSTSSMQSLLSGGNFPVAPR